MSNGRRFYNMLSGYIDREWERIRDIVEQGAEHRPAAEEEFEQAMGRKYEKVPAEPTQPDAPRMTDPPTPAPPQTVVTELECHYAVLGVPNGADFAVVRYAYQKLVRRADPARFVDGSESAKQAEQVRARVEEAYDKLRRALDPRSARFSDLA